MVEGGGVDGGGPADVSVRPARVDDVPALAALQVRTWRRTYAGLLPEAALAALDEPAAVEAWTEAVRAAPTPRHRVLVALAGPEVVGLAATTPAGDPDSDAATDAELTALLVGPESTRAGHGSRLLAAVSDGWRQSGTVRAVSWVPAADEALQAFLGSAGWAPDGARRELDTGGGALVLIRLHTALA